METTASLIASIKDNLVQANTSHKDEVAVMQSMLSDPTYEVTVYGHSGPTGTYNPCKDFRGMCSSIIANTAKVNQAEAANLMEGYVPKRTEAESMVSISKEFVNTFLQTGRKLSLGGRETSNIALTLRKVPETTRSCPHKNADGTYQRVPTTIPAHDALKVSASCPPWAKAKK